MCYDELTMLTLSNIELTMSDPRCVDVSMSSTVHCMVSRMIKHLAVMNMYIKLYLYSTSSPLSCDVVCFKTMLLAVLVAHSDFSPRFVLPSSLRIYMFHRSAPCCTRNTVFQQCPSCANAPRTPHGMQADALIEM